ncbi:MAG: tRNA epoxyqueuosine(34) reductase QueG [Myxococcota bacterium]
MPSDGAELVSAIEFKARSLGFARIGVCASAPFERGDRALRQWLSRGYHGDMEYLAGASSRADPDTLLPGAKSMIVVALPYQAPPPEPRTQPPADLHGSADTESKIAAYARGHDYHGVLKAKLNELAREIETLSGRPIRSRACVDTAPLLEREAAMRAGIGFLAKSTMVISPGLGSYILLGELLVDIELPPSKPERSRCGSCTQCLDACPTDAFVDAFILDARRCISYLTIEYRGWIPRELRALMGTWVFGCDVCQQVCPFNASKQPRPVAPELAPRLEPMELVDLLNIGAAAHRRLATGSALRRAPRWQLARNAAVALGNITDSRVVRPLEHALCHSIYPLVRGHAAWALERHRAQSALRTQAKRETDVDVQNEIELSLKVLGEDPKDVGV